MQPIRLGDEAPFTLGRVVVTPASRTLAIGGAVLLIEPRVMQVLVVLGRRTGEVVGRETLVDACWDGRTVGEDAVNRAILKLRRALDEVGGAVTVETVAKVGYRLCLGETVPVADRAPARGPALRWAPAGAVVLAVLGAAGWLLLGPHPAAERTRIVAVQPLHVAGRDVPARRLSLDFANDLSRAVLGHDGELRFTDADGAPPRTAAFTVSGEVASVGEDLHAVVAVRRRDDPAILWSHDYTAPLVDATSLRRQVSTNVAKVLVCAIGTRGVPDAIDARATALYLEACNLHSGDQRQVAYLLRQVTARAPLFAGGWADLAVSLALASGAANGSDAGPMRREADEAARRALSLDPHQGDAYYAQALLLPGIRNWIARERIVGNGLRAEPDNPQLYNRRAIDLAAIGREQDSIAVNRRAVALDPLFPGKMARLVHALAIAGALDEADDAVRRMRETWPDDDYTWHARFETAAWIGDPREAEAMLDDPRDPRGREEAAGWRVFLKARAAPTRANVDKAVAALLDDRRRDGSTDARLVDGLSLLDRAEAAIGIALRMPVQTESDFWFRSFLGRFRADPRFMTIAERQGLGAVWRATGLWPDFCSDGSVPYSCRTIASTPQRTAGVDQNAQAGTRPRR